MGEKVQGHLNNGVDVRFEEYMLDHEINESEAVRRCIDAGLRKKGYPRQVKPRLFAVLSGFSMIVAISWLAAAYFFSNLPLYRGAALMAVIALLSGFTAYVYREFDAPARSAWRYLVGGRA